MGVGKLYRLLRLVTMLQSGRSWTVEQIAQELGVARRTVFRDLNVLELAHIPYYYDAQRKTYRVNQHFFLPPVNLTLDEALALLMQSRRARAGLPLAAAGQRAAMKLESLLPAALRHDVGTVLERLTLRPPAVARHEGLDELFERLAGAVAGHRLCRIVYISFLDRKQITCTLEPLRLAFIERAWYVVGWSRSHRQQRTFKLSRIRALSVLEETFDPAVRPLAPPGQEFGQAWSMIPEGQVYPVHLRFAAKVAGNVAEVSWHPSQEVTWNDDGSIDFRARVDGLGEITWWILGYGDQVKVLAPAALSDRVLQTARRVAAQYETGG